ncbi:hypothetical protein K2F43_05975 [Clostridium estertheticum]|uniref:hypothetical protein n=1 Tax=Clostridium estertheticum TaxID=238834 RepID=UPI001C6EF6BF|nr:hypothetical protein [Clostridium estertheticum]MBW9170753.1 hypothetical protein [Clostridium estertheticum]WLC74407.1 hypothetical protein KTC99_16775 [Clostridium estertheticum]
MKNNIIIELEKRLLEETKVTIEDTSETTILKTIKQEDMSLENILISLYNLAKINQYKIKSLESNLNLLASRVYKTNEDFTENEKYEISEALGSFDLEELTNNFDKELLQDMLYMGEDEKNYDEEYRLQKELMNKINYPTPTMYETFNKLVTEQIENMG